MMSYYVGPIEYRCLVTFCHCGDLRKRGFRRFLTCYSRTAFQLCCSHPMAPVSSMRCYGSLPPGLCLRTFSGDTVDFRFSNLCMGSDREQICSIPIS